MNISYCTRLLVAIAVTFALPPIGSSFGAEPETKEPAKKTKPDEQWKTLFDGKTLKNWEVVEKYDFKRHGKVYAKDQCLILEEGNPATGIRWTADFPKVDYEISFEGKRIKGSDFFCGMTFPVGDEGMTLILGGWGGWVVGLSLINEDVAVDNETCQAIEFENDRWYRARVKVSKKRVEVWIDEDKVIDLLKEDRKYSVDWRMEATMPFGFATWITAGAVRNLRLRTFKDE